MGLTRIANDKLEKFRLKSSRVLLFGGDHDSNVCLGEISASGGSTVAGFDGTVLNVLVRYKPHFHHLK